MIQDKEKNEGISERQLNEYQIIECVKKVKRKLRMKEENEGRKEGRKKKRKKKKTKINVGK